MADVTLTTKVAIKRDYAMSSKGSLRRLIEEWNKLTKYLATCDFGSINADATATLVFDVAAAEGVLIDETFLAIPPANWPTGLICELVYANAANQITVRVRNVSAGAIDAPSGDWTFIRYRAAQLLVRG